MKSTPTESSREASSGVTGVNLSSGDYVTSVLITAATSILFVVATPALWHWFVLPAAACGSLIGVDAVRWARGKVGVFSPIGTIGVFGWHFFFLAPLLHVRWQQWPSDITPPADWRTWLGFMAVVNIVGIAAYRFGLHSSSKRPRGLPGAIRRLEWTRFSRVMATAIMISAALEVYVFSRGGGYQGYESAVLGQGTLAGLGWLLTLGESVVLLCFIMWVAKIALATVRPPTSTKVFLAIATFAVFQFAVSGARGSRGNLVFPVIIAAGLIHSLVRPLSRSRLALLLVVCAVFMYLYGFYKVAGQQGLSSALTTHDRAKLEQESGRTLPALLLQDLGRADIQAFLLYRLEQPTSGYSPAHGMTYVAGVAAIVPSALLPNRPPGKLKSGTDLMYGPGAYAAKGFHAENIYGLGGEALLNFGVTFVPIAYLALGAFVARMESFTRRLSAGDARLLLAPSLPPLCILLLASDIGNVAYAAVQYSLVPFVVVYLGSNRVRSATSFGRPVPETDRFVSTTPGRSSAI